MKRSVIAGILLSAGAGCAGVQAAESFNVNIRGTISPAACEATIAGGNTFDYGHIATESLKAAAGGINKLDGKSANLTINCNAPTKISLKATDNRAATGSRFDGQSLAGIMLANITTFGLGSDSSSNKIGGYSMFFTSVNVDIGDMHTLKSTDGGTSWADGGGGMLFSGMMNREWSVARPDELTPAAFKTLNARIQLQAAINPVSTLDLSQPITLDGSVTFEMRYL